MEKKGVEEDRYSVDKLVEDIEWLGCSQIIVKSHNGPAIVDVLAEALKSFKVNTVDQTMGEHPAPYDSKEHGAFENAVKQVQRLARTLKIALKRAISKCIPLEHPVISWLVEHAAFVLTARRFKDDGMTAYQHLRGRQFVKSFMVFGERCGWKLLEKAQPESGLEDSTRAAPPPPPGAAPV